MDNKYLKYKIKYINLKKQLAGSSTESPPPPPPPPPNTLYLNVTNIISMEHMQTALREIKKLSDVTIKTTARGTVISIKQDKLTETLFIQITRNLNIYFDTIGIKYRQDPEDEFTDCLKSIFTFEVVSNLLSESSQLVFQFIIIPIEEVIKQRLIADNYTSLQVYNRPTGVLYKCDYDFTDIRYRQPDGSMRYIETIFDSGNSATTLINSNSVMRLGLETIPIYTTRHNLTSYNNKLNEIFENNTANIDNLRLDENTNITLEEFLRKVDMIADIIREQNHRDPNVNNEDLLLIFGVAGTKGVGGMGSCTMSRVLLPFIITGFPGRYFISADINNGTDGVLFSKHDMAFLEQRGLSFGYNEAFQRQHIILKEIKKQIKEEDILYQQENARALNRDQRIQAYRRHISVIRVLILRIHELKETDHTGVISIYRTILPLGQGHLETTPRGTHVQPIYDPTPDTTTVFTDLFNRLERANRDVRESLFERIGRIGFTVDQLEKLKEIKEE